jgi:Polyketide cyclase / dehydrase and lipid transport
MNATAAAAYGSPPGPPFIAPLASTPTSAHAELGFDAPVDAAFAYITDLQNIVVWWPEHTSYRRIVGGGGPGSMYVWRYATTGLPLAGMSLVLQRTPDQRFVYMVRSVGIWVGFTYEFRGEGERCRVGFTMRSYLLPPPIPPAQLVTAFERLASILAAGADR